ncbi:YjgF-like protein [Cucurbitaria berberidis CBS 394.84]|uniref:YjgF-like protein n=1 Tax=Cucurbitaria berberidis CBS 394.84 TaxID=1168544 RepID=A0A9P4GE75_9PLEO|nr:YjgF-like protein [Cucurbitaria berberidis CBS 394.84]KAF1843686.1 YjgF-like protein [Cucurbitaria berberidis CBS 394.84]
MPPSTSTSKLGAHGFSFWNWPGAGEAAAEQMGLSHAVVIPANARTIVVGGQVGIRDDGKVPSSIEEEVLEAFDHVERALKAAGLKEDAWEFVYKVNVVFADSENHPELGPSLGKAMQKYCKGTRPAVTGYTVQSLFMPSLHIEVEVQAFLP